MRCVLMPVLLLTAVTVVARAPAGQEVLLLNGFEPEVLKEWAGKRKAPKWSYVRVVRIGEDGMPYGGGMVGAIAKGDATQGEYALVRPIPNPASKRDYSLRYLAKNSLESIRRSRGVLLNTFGTFRDFYPSDGRPTRGCVLTSRARARRCAARGD